MVRAVLKDNKVPGTSTGTRAAAAPGPVPTGSAVTFLGEGQAGLYERPGACLDHWVRIGGIFQKETLHSCLENSPQQLRLLHPYPASPGSVCTQSTAQLQPSLTHIPSTGISAHPICSLAEDCPHPHQKHQGRSTSHIATVPRAPAGPTGSLGGRQKHPTYRSCRAQGVGGWQSPERFDSVGG